MRVTVQLLSSSPSFRKKFAAALHILGEDGQDLRELAILNENMRWRTQGAGALHCLFDTAGKRAAVAR